MHNQGTRGCSLGNCFVCSRAIAQSGQQAIHVCSTCYNLMGSRVMAQQGLQVTNSHSLGNSHSLSNNYMGLGSMVQQRQWMLPIHTCILCHISFPTTQALRGHLNEHQQEIEAMRRQQGRGLNMSRGLLPSLIPPSRNNDRIIEREVLRREQREDLNLLSREALPSPMPPSFPLDLTLGNRCDNRLEKGPTPVTQITVPAKERVLVPEDVPHNISRNNGSLSVTNQGAKLKRTRDEFEGGKRRKAHPEELDLTLKL